MKLRKMFLVSEDYYNKNCIAPIKERTKLLKTKAIVKKRTKRPKAKAPVKKWVKILQNREEKKHRDALKLKAAADILKKILPVPISQPDVKHNMITPVPNTTRTLKSKRSFIPLRQKAFIHETPKRPAEYEDDDDDDDDTDDDEPNIPEEEEVKRFGKETFGTLASPYLTPYIYDTRRLDTLYGIRKDGDVFKIGDSTVTIDSDSNIHVKGREYKGTEGLLELLTRKNVKHERITTSDLKNYKAILVSTNSHLENYKPSGNIQISRGIKFRDVIAPLFGGAKKKRGIETAMRRKWLTYQ
jgi:hypothetical protein